MGATGSREVFVEGEHTLGGLLQLRDVFIDMGGVGGLVRECLRQLVQQDRQVAHTRFGGERLSFSRNFAAPERRVVTMYSSVSKVVSIATTGGSLIARTWLSTVSPWTATGIANWPLRVTMCSAFETVVTVATPGSAGWMRSACRAATRAPSGSGSRRRVPRR